MRTIGSQKRELLKDSGYKLISRPSPGVIILQDVESNKQEYWFVHDHYAGYVIQIGRWGYEFASDCPYSKLSKLVKSFTPINYQNKV